MPSLDLIVLAGYLAAVIGCGFYFSRRSQSSGQYMAAGRSLPGWAVGLSMFGSYISSISFLANPGAAYRSNWNALAFTLATPLAALVAIRWFVPLYRRSGDISAYQRLEHRFGRWARTYATVCFLLLQVARMGTIIYLMSIAVAPLTGWFPYRSRQVMRICWPVPYWRLSKTTSPWARRSTKHMMSESGIG